MPAADAQDLVCQFQHLVRPTVLRIVGRLDAELTSVGYLALVLAAAKYDAARGAFEPYARKKISFAIIDRLRYEKRRACEELSEHPAPDPGLTLKLDIQRALETLPPRERLLLHLRFWRGLTIENAAAAAGCSERAAKAAGARAVATLRTRLGC